MKTITPTDPGCLITSEQLQKALPKGMRVHNVSNLLNSVNDAIRADDEMAHCLRDNIIGFSSVLKDGVYKASDYINAVKFVSYKILGKTTVEAYAAALPDRYQRLVDKLTSEKDINSYAGAYRRGVLVNKILEQTLVPTHILNASVYQSAINKLAVLMMTAESEKVQCDAATSLVVNLKAPVAAVVELNISHGENKSIEDLRKSVIELGEAQKEAIKAGIPVQQIAHSKLSDSSILEGEFTEDTE